MVRRTVLMIGIVFALAGLSSSAQDPMAERAGRTEAPLAERIGHTDPSKFRHNDRRHEGAAAGMDVMTLVEGRRMQTNLLYMFREASRRRAVSGITTTRAWKRCS